MTCAKLSEAEVLVEHGIQDVLIANQEAVREGWMTAPLMVAQGPPPRQPVATWDELRRELGADRYDR